MVINTEIVLHGILLSQLLKNNGSIRFNVQHSDYYVPHAELLTVILRSGTA